MPKAKSSKPVAGQRVRVRSGVTMPEFPDLSIAGWNASVVEATGSGAKLKVYLQWDEEAVAALPQSYREHCEAGGLELTMACLPGTAVELLDEQP